MSALHTGCKALVIVKVKIGNAPSMNCPSQCERESIISILDPRNNQSLATAKFNKATKLNRTELPVRVVQLLVAQQEFCRLRHFAN